MKRVRLFLLILLLLPGCGNEERRMTYQPQEAGISELGIQRINRLRVHFGHQSVGSNVIAGVRQVASERPSLKLAICEADGATIPAGPVFAHFKVGRNTDPESKLASFREHVMARVRDGEVALFKFCYVDIGAGSDAEELFQKYRRTLDELRKQRPEVSYVHVTIPLQSVDSGLKRVVKKAVGKSTGEEANAARTRYNDLLRRENFGREPLFDLAAAESTAPDGTRCQGEVGGARYEALCPMYTDDGGHLNGEGGRRAAFELLRVLGDVGEKVARR